MIKEYKREISGFVAGYIWSILVLTLGAHKTVQESVCSVESITGGIVSIEACNGYLAVLQEVAGGDIVFHLAAAFSGVLLAFGLHILKDY